MTRSKTSSTLRGAATEEVQPPPVFSGEYMALGRGDESLAGKDDGRKPELGFRSPPVPEIFLSESYKGCWILEEVPKTLHSYRRPLYRVFAVETKEIAWVGHDREVGKALCDRLSGWWDARNFPPPPMQAGPAVPIQAS